MPPKKGDHISPLARIRKESNPPWPPASKKLISMAHAFSRLWWELWEYHDEARWILEGEVEAVCDEIEQLRAIVLVEDESLDPVERSPEMKRAQEHLVLDYQEAMVMQKKMRAWTANCRTYLRRLVKERRALVAQIVSEGNGLGSIGMDRWRYWFMGSFDKLGREEVVFHLPLEDFIRCKGSAKEHARIRLEEYGEGYESDDSKDELENDAVYLDQGLVPIAVHVDEIHFDRGREIYHLVLEGN
ncbi:uncharacterized protein H6S33_011472 [Morchella sextelata]|uniref:uncharacterized protein n=1 Tax=Morchella sextelata TaxID=1174677 RepID=UPI001D03F820|nr:uncharacterized protein H6S33_011472 [Morchella sextelata]KAH0611045.1 hypothetical protein H6S33_011472 [Morchella sextelata]